MLAADRANDALAFEDAVKYLESAIDIVPALGNDTHAQLLNRKAVSPQGSELVEESIACLHDAVEIADSIDLEDKLGERAWNAYRRRQAIVQLLHWRGAAAVKGRHAILAGLPHSDTCWAVAGAFKRDATFVAEDLGDLGQLPTDRA